MLLNIDSQTIISLFSFHNLQMWQDYRSSSWTIHTKTLEWLLSQRISPCLLPCTVIFSQVLQLGKDHRRVSFWESKYYRHIMYSCDRQFFDSIMFCRNKRKYGSADENSTTCKAMKGIQVFNGMECQISCGSSKVLHWSSTLSFKFSLYTLKHRCFFFSDTVCRRYRRFLIPNEKEEKTSKWRYHS